MTLSPAVTRSGAVRHRVLIGTPFRDGSCCVQYLTSMLRLFAEAPKYGVEVELFTHSGDALIGNAREAIAHHFWQGTWSHLLFVDADMGFRVEDLLGMLESKKPLVAGIGPHKSINWAKVAEGPDNDDTTWCREPSRVARSGSSLAVRLLPDLTVDESGCLEVEYVGSGFMLIAREVVEKLRAEHRELLNDRTGQTVCGLFDQLYVGREKLSEDYSFCHRWGRIGGQVHAYVQADLEHVGSYVYKGNLLDHTSQSSP